MTEPLTIQHHQVLIIPKKEGYNVENGHLTLQVKGVEDIPRSIVGRPR